jgi:alkylhydroperoxidase/carboxymuconolactone decarboxylase family protein YurZ
MKTLDRRIARLIAVGASVAANCQPCLETVMAKARQEQIKEKDIIEAIEIGKLVRHCAASQMDEFALSIAGAETVRSSQSSQNGACGCAALGK